MWYILPYEMFYFPLFFSPFARCSSKGPLPFFLLSSHPRCYRFKTVSSSLTWTFPVFSLWFCMTFYSFHTWGVYSHFKDWLTLILGLMLFLFFSLLYICVCVCELHLLLVKVCSSSLGSSSFGFGVYFPTYRWFETSRFPNYINFMR